MVYNFGASLILVVCMLCLAESFVKLPHLRPVMVAERFKYHSSAPDKLPDPVQEEVEISERTQSDAGKGSADKQMFDMNQRVRLGRSKDQDGKSNIWSVEPRQEVVGEEDSQVKMNLVVGGVVVGLALVSLPLLLAFNHFVLEK
jgi:hypothetical protein